MAYAMSTLVKGIEQLEQKSLTNLRVTYLYYAKIKYSDWLLGTSHVTTFNQSECIICLKFEVKCKQLNGNLPMAEFKPVSSGFVSNRRATAIALSSSDLIFCFFSQNGPNQFCIWLVERKKVILRPNWFCVKILKKLDSKLFSQSFQTTI